MLVSVLPARAGRSEPPVREISLAALIIGRRGLLSRKEDRDSNSAGMDAPSALGWWDSLNPVTTGFIGKTLGGIFCLNRHESVSDDDAGQSALLGQVAFVGATEFGHEEFGVFPALSGADF